ncbi:MAG: glycosyltransferase family 9 protein [Phycisphaerales bacterium]|nr:glycosyltransferase family 9 protein [Phycisphaerales bacterium]
MLTVPNRILIVRPSALGDVARSVALLASLRVAYPDAAIDWVVQDSFVDAVRAHPALTRVIPFPRRDVPKITNLLSVGRRWVGWMAAIRRSRYDMVIDAQGLLRSAIIARLSGAPRRIGHADAREKSWLLMNERVKSTDSHAVARSLALALAAGGKRVADLRLTVPPKCIEWWESKRRTLIGEDSYAVLAPTSRWVSKQWPAERFDQLARWMIASKLVSRVIVVGAESEAAQLSGMTARSEPWCVDLVGRTSVGNLMAVLREAAVIVANDSAPLHLAVGLARPYVGVFGATDPRLVGPYLGDRWVVSAAGISPDPHAYRAARESCLRSIDVESVANLAMAAMRSPEWFQRVASGEPSQGTTHA